MNDNQTLNAARCIQILPDHHTERSGYVRAFETDGPDAPTCCPCIGYCSPGGSHRTARACIAELRQLRRYAGLQVYNATGRRLAIV